MNLKSLDGLPGVSKKRKGQEGAVAAMVEEWMDWSKRKAIDNVYVWGTGVLMLCLGYQLGKAF